jgi:CelD/BcsL family acetyltransferase involved in cellulose biosynthesis
MSDRAIDEAGEPSPTVGGRPAAGTRPRAGGRFEATPAARVLRFDTMPFDTLWPAEIDAWHRMREANPSLDSPYFHPGFAAVVHASGHTVHVVVGRDGDDGVRALLPVHRDGSSFRPVGWPGADFQGPILTPGTTLNPLDLIGDGVRSYEFDHLVDGYADFAPWIDTTRPSPYVDTTGGLVGYLGRASGSGKDNMGQARRRAAKATRAYGAVRFEADVVDETALRRVIELKRAQYEATGARDYFAEPYRVDLLTRLLRTRGTEFAGILSTLYVGPHLFAAHFGMRAGGVLHWWFPVYDPQFSAFSPGWMLLRELVEASPALGIVRIDFGRGDDEYKRRAKTGETMVSQGVVTRRSIDRKLRRTRDSLVDAAKASPLGPGLRRIARKLR